ncbi:MAG: hypothetical protein SFV51_32335, partial [Bryobacteraceae bacterium]|nr:hypothetical protein [Bryobacteraceae bacterium]
MTTTTTAKLSAFHGKPEIKTEYLKRVQAHRAADQLVQGYGYWKDGKGCAVGCTIHSGEHAAYETKLGIPRVIARLEDGIFEGLPQAEARLWPERFLAAIPVGADLALVTPKFLHWLLVDAEQGVIRHARTDEQRKAIQEVADLFAKKIAGAKVSRAEWLKVREAAWAAAAAYAAAAA